MDDDRFFYAVSLPCLWYRRFKKKMVEEVEHKNFKFRHLSNVQIGEATDYGDARYSLLCVSNEFGLTFVGTKEGVHVFKTAMLFTLHKDESMKNKVDLNMLKSVLVPTPSPPVDVSLSRDSLTLSVCLKEKGMLRCLFFDTVLLDVQNANRLPFCDFPLSTEPGTDLCGLQWNPNLQYSDRLVFSLSTGLLQLISIKDSVAVIASISSMHATSVCWSPKGKQVCVGLKSGEVIQLSQTFEEKKRHACPSIFQGTSTQVSDIFWLSPYFFSIVYCSQSNIVKIPNFVFLATSKEGPTCVSAADDVYGGEGAKMNKFHFSYLDKWGILISSSSNAMETAVFGRSPERSNVWQKYDLDGTERAEFPIDTASNNETYALGMAVDRTSQQPVVISDELTLPPCPLLLLYSDHGVLCPFVIINMDQPMEELQNLCVPPKPLPTVPTRKPVIPSQDISLASMAKCVTQSTGSVQGQASRGSAPVYVSSTQPTKGITSTMSGLAMPGGGSGVVVNFGLSGLTPSLPGLFAKGQASNFPPNSSSTKAALQGIGTLTKQSPVCGIGTPASWPLAYGIRPPSSQPPGRGIGQPLGQPAVHGVGPPLHASTPAALLLQGNPPHSLQHVAHGVSIACPRLSNAGLSTASASLSFMGIPTVSPLTTTGSSESPVPPTAPFMGVPSARPPVMGPQSPGPPTAPLMGIPSARSPVMGPPTAPLKGIPSARSPVMGPPTAPLVGIPSAKSPVMGPPAAPLKGIPSAKSPVMGPPTAPLKGIPSAKSPVMGPQSPVPPTAPLMDIPSARPPVMGPQSTGSSIGATQAAKLGIPTTSVATKSPPKAGPPTDIASLAASTNKDPPANAAAQEQLDRHFASCISSATHTFAEELGGLRQLVSNVCCGKEGKEEVLPGLGSLRDLRCIEEQVRDVQLQVKQGNHAFKRLQRLCEHQEEDILRICETQAQTKGAMSKSKDYNYALLQRLRPLDNVSSETLTKTRSKFLHMKYSLDEVMAELDQQLELSYAEKRQQGRDPMKVPSLHIIYSLLKDHHRISRLQRDEIERVMQRMKKLKLIPYSWQPEVLMSRSPIAKLSPGTSSWRSGSGSAGEHCGITPSPRAIVGRREGSKAKQDRSRVVQEDKVEKLKEYFENIHLTPVKKVAAARPTSERSIPATSTQPGPSASKRPSAQPARPTSDYELPTLTTFMQPAPPTSVPPIPTMCAQPAPPISEPPQLATPTSNPPQLAPPTSKPQLFTTFMQPAPPTYAFPTFMQQAPPTSVPTTLTTFKNPAPPTSVFPTFTTFMQQAPPTSVPTTLTTFMQAPLTSVPTTLTTFKKPAPPTSVFPTFTTFMQQAPPTSVPTTLTTFMQAPPTSVPTTLTTFKQPAPPTSVFPTFTTLMQQAPPTSVPTTLTTFKQQAPPTSVPTTLTTFKQQAPPTFVPTTLTTFMQAPLTSVSSTFTTLKQPVPPTSVPTTLKQPAPPTSVPTTLTTFMQAPPTSVPTTLTTFKQAPPTSVSPTLTTFMQASVPTTLKQPAPPTSEPPISTQPARPNSEPPPAMQPVASEPPIPTAIPQPAPPTSEPPTSTRPAPPSSELPTSTRPAPPTSELPTSTQPAPPTSELPTSTRPAPPTSELPTSTRPAPPTSELPTSTRPAPPTYEPPIPTSSALPTSSKSQAIPTSKFIPAPPTNSMTSATPTSFKSTGCSTTSKAPLVPPPSTAVPLLPGNSSSSLPLTTVTQSVSQSLLMSRQVQLAGSQSSVASAHDDDAMGDDMESADSTQDGGKISLCSFGLGSTPKNPVSANPFAAGTFVGSLSQSLGSTSTGATLLRQPALGSLAPSNFQSPSVQGGSFSGGSSFGAKSGLESGGLSFGGLPSLGGVSSIGPAIVDNMKKFGTADSGLTFGGLAQQQGGGGTGFDSSGGGGTEFGSSGYVFGSSGNAFGSSNTAFGSSNTAFGSSNTAFGSSNTAFGSSNTAFGGSNTAFGGPGDSSGGFVSSSSGMSGSAFTNWRR